MRIGIYCRVSSLNQIKEGNSINNQKLEELSIVRKRDMIMKYLKM